MRKVLFYTMLASLFLIGSTILSHAQSRGMLNVTYGKIPKYAKGQTAAITTEFTKTTWDENKSMKRFWYVEYQENYFEEEMEEKYGEYLTSLRNAVIIGFRSGRTPLVFSEEEADYTLAITITNFHDTRDLWRRCVMGFGRIDVIDNATGETVCQMDINGVKGGDDLDEATAAAKCMKEIGALLSDKRR